jgi:hypothetical protein
VCVVAAFVLLVHLASLFVECDDGVDGAACQAGCECDLRDGEAEQVQLDDTLVCLVCECVLRALARHGGVSCEQQRSATRVQPPVNRVIQLS